MEYTRDTLDRQTGDLVPVSIGDWITVTELGDRYGVGARKVRAVLRHMGFLYLPATDNRSAHRAAPWVLDKGFAKHHRKSKNVKFPFDVIGPNGQAWIAERWSEAAKVVELEQGEGCVVSARIALDDFKASRGRHDMTTQQEACWLFDHFQNLSQQQVASVLGVSQQLVSRYQDIRRKHQAKQLANMQAIKSEEPMKGGTDDGGLTVTMLARAYPKDIHSFHPDLGEIDNGSPQHPEKHRPTEVFKAA